MRLLLSLSLLPVACTTHDPADDFVGTWTYYRSQVMTSCNNAAPQTSDLVGSFTLTRSGDGLTIDRASQYSLFVVASGDCIPTFSVGGDIQADIVPQGSCTLTTTNGTVIDVSYSLYELKLADVTGPDIAPMTPGIDVDLEADLSSVNGNCQVSSSATAITSQ